MRSAIYSIIGLALVVTSGILLNLGEEIAAIYSIIVGLKSIDWADEERNK